MRCDECRFWAVNEACNEEGICRRYAARPLIGTDLLDLSVSWPETQADDWCGEFELSTEETR